MRLILLVMILALSLFGGQIVQGQVAAGEEAAGVEIAGTLHQMYDAEKRRDLKFVLSHLAPDFTEVAGDGNLYHKPDIEAGWQDMVLNDYRLSDCVFKLMTREAAYLTCRMEVDATYKGQTLPKRFRLTTVWTRQKNKWLLRFEQGTVIPEPGK